MLDRGAAESPGWAPAVMPRRPGRERRRALIACAVLALALHAAFIGSIGGLVPGSPETAVAPMSLRTLPDEPAEEAKAPAAPVPPAPVVTPPAPAPAARPARRPREPLPAASQAADKH